MSVNGYSKIERGKSGINLDKLRQIAQIFNIDVVELLAEQNRSFSSLSATIPITIIILSALMKCWCLKMKIEVAAGCKG